MTCCSFSKFHIFYWIDIDRKWRASAEAKSESKCLVCEECPSIFILRFQLCHGTLQNILNDNRCQFLRFSAVSEELSSYRFLLVWRILSTKTDYIYQPSSRSACYPMRFRLNWVHCWLYLQKCKDRRKGNFKVNETVIQHHQNSNRDAFWRLNLKITEVLLSFSVAAYLSDLTEKWNSSRFKRYLRSSDANCYGFNQSSLVESTVSSCLFMLSECTIYWRLSLRRFFWSKRKAISCLKPQKYEKVDQ